MSYYKSHLLIQKVAKSITKDQTQTKIANLLYHHTNPNLLPYRRPGSLSYLLHHLSSSFNAIVSLCTSQSSRDQFLSLSSSANNNNDTSYPTEDNYNDDDGYHGPIINTSVLGQSDMGFLKSLTLFQDLNNPLYEQYPQFNPREFLCGVGYGLEQFHKVKDELLPRMVKHGEDVQSTVDDDDDAKEATVEADFSKYKILDIAEKDPDSLENRLVSMSTPEVLQAIQMDGIIRLLFDNMNKTESVNMPMGRNDEVNRLKEYYAKNFITDDTKVNNIALLNARIEEIYPPPPTVATEQKSQKKDSEDPDAPLEDDSLTPPEHNNDDSIAPQVVTQLDVLYELQQSSINGEGKTHTQSSMMVGKFETCLSGDPNSNDTKDLQWRIASYRSAVEFYNTF